MGCGSLPASTTRAGVKGRGDRKAVRKRQSGSWTGGWINHGFLELPRCFATTWSDMFMVRRKKWRTPDSALTCSRTHSWWWEHCSWHQAFFSSSPCVSTPEWRAGSSAGTWGRPRTTLFTGRITRCWVPPGWRNGRTVSEPRSKCWRRKWRALVWAFETHLMKKKGWVWRNEGAWKKQRSNAAKKNVKEPIAMSDSSHHLEIHQTKPNRTTSQIPTPPKCVKPLNSPNCPKLHSHPNLQPPRNPQLTHKMTSMNCIGNGKLSPLCLESVGCLGPRALSPLHTLRSWERLGQVAPLILQGCKRLAGPLSGSLPAQSCPTLTQWRGSTLGTYFLSWVPTWWRGVEHKCLEGNTSPSDIFSSFLPSVFYCKPPLSPLVITLYVGGVVTPNVEDSKDKGTFSQDSISI